MFKCIDYLNSVLYYCKWYDWLLKKWLTIHQFFRERHEKNIFHTLLHQIIPKQMKMALTFGSLWIVHSYNLFNPSLLLPELSKFHLFSIHLLSQNPVGIFKAQNSKSQLVFSDSAGVPGFLSCKIIFPETESRVKVN